MKQFLSKLISGWSSILGKARPGQASVGQDAEAGEQTDRLWQQHMQAAQQAEQVNDSLGALSSYESALHLAESMPPADGHLLKTLSSFGPFHLAQGRLPEAESLFRRAIPLCEDTKGAAHQDVATLQNNLAEALRLQGRFDEAKPIYLYALVIRERTFGNDHPDTGLVLNNLALMEQAQGNFASAETRFRRVLAIFETGRGPDHADTATVLNSMGMLALAQSKFDEAQEFFERALEIWRKSLPPNHPNIAGVQKTIAEMTVRRDAEDEKARLEFADVLAKRAAVAPPAVKNPPQLLLKLSYREQVVVMQPEGNEVSIGRGPGNSIVIASKYVSRNHAKILWKQSPSPRLVNLSQLGTAVCPQGDTRYIACNPELVLVGTGTIALSAKAAEAVADGDFLSFELSTA